MTSVIEVLVPFAKNLVLAIVVLVVGLKLIKWVTGKTQRKVKTASLDDTLKPFIGTVVNVSLKVLLIVSVVKVIGVDTSSIIALVASAGLAIGLAFQGALSNFAGGLLLLIVRPIRVGDYVEADGRGGTVQAIQLLYTELVTIYNQVIYIPNSRMANTNIINYSQNNTRQMEFKFSVAYTSDTRQVKRVLRDVVTSHDKILEEPEPFIRMFEHADNAIVYIVRAWANSEDYWGAYYDLIEQVKNRFDEEGIEIPYPQMDIHLEPLIREKTVG